MCPGYVCVCVGTYFIFFASDLSITLTALGVLKTLPSVLLTTVKAGAKWRWSSYSRPADPRHQHKLEAEFLARRERDASPFLHHRTITTSKTRCEEENSYSVLCGQFMNATAIFIKYASNFFFFFLRLSYRFLTVQQVDHSRRTDSTVALGA